MAVDRRSLTIAIILAVGLVVWGSVLLWTANRPQIGDPRRADAQAGEGMTYTQVNGWTFQRISPADMNGIILIRHDRTGTCLARGIREGVSPNPNLVVLPNEACADIR